MSNFIGPALPPHMKKILSENRGSKTDCNEDDVVTAEISDEEYHEDHRDVRKELPSDAGEVYGPALPPGYRPTVVGPAAPVPSSLKGPPSSPPKFMNKSSEDEGDVVGPMPASNMAENVKEQLQEQLESRAHKMKEKLTGKEASSQKIKRESWMLELPPEKAVQFGLGARQFRTRTDQGTGDRSVWTDTPDVREKKSLQQPAAPADELRHKALKDRDKHMEKLTEGYSNKRPKESLLESHQKKLKSEKKGSSSSKQERRPFDRDIDLQANRFDEAQKKAIFKKAQLLNDRFSSGESKYL